MNVSNRITCFDLNDINYSSYFLAGLELNSRKYNYDYRVSNIISKDLRSAICHEEYRNILFAVIPFKARINENDFYFCIDCHDISSSSKGQYKGYHIPLLNKVDYYFKVNYNKDQINSDPLLKSFRNKIYPVKPFFPVQLPKSYRYFPGFIPQYQYDWTLRKMVRRLRHIKNLMTLEDIRRLRYSPKKYDLFFVMHYYDQQVHSVDDEYRLLLVKKLRENFSNDSIIGLTSHSRLPEGFEQFRIERMTFKKYLSNLAASKVAIYIRGVHDCLSFKFGEYLALGLPVIGQTIYNNSENLMKFTNFERQFNFNDPDEIIESVKVLLFNDEMKREIAISNTGIFEQYFTPEAVIDELLKIIFYSEDENLYKFKPMDCVTSRNITLLKK